MPRNFIPRPEPCGNPILYYPAPEIPNNLMDAKKAEQAQAALDTCIIYAGNFGEKLNQAEKSSEFQTAAQSFEAATGVQIRAVLNSAREVLFSLPV